MKKLFILYIASLSFIIQAQGKFSVYTELAQGASYHWREGLFLDSDVNIGGQLKTSKGTLVIFSKYRFGGYVSEEFTPYSINYSALGLGVKFRLFSPLKKVSPFARLEVATQLNHKTPPPNFSETSLSSYFYTPYFGALILGVDIRILNNLNLSFGIGAEMREMRIYYNPPTYDMTIINGLTAQIGMSYTFSLKKKVEIRTDK